MEEIIITFAEVDVDEPTFFVCHAHFPGAQNVKVAPAISQETIFRPQSEAKCTIVINNPTHYEGLCIVLLRKLHSSVVGWQPHARCRLKSSASGYQGILIEESTLKQCGKLELTIPKKWLSSTQNSEKNDESQLLRKWFLVPSEQKEMVAEFVKEATSWFIKKKTIP